jgi:hypothetical protein
MAGFHREDHWAIRKNADNAAAVRRRAEEAEEAAIRGERAIEELLAAVRRPKSETVQVNRLITEAWTIFRTCRRRNRSRSAPGRRDCRF